MEKILHQTLLALSNDVEATAIPSDGKHTAAWCLGRLPKLYKDYAATHESRFGDEITRLVQVLMTELSRSKVECKEAQAIARDMPGRFQTLHERLSLPLLMLKAPAPASSGGAKKKVAKRKA